MGILDQGVLVVLGILGQVVLAAGGTFQAARGKGQRAESREVQGRVQAVDVLHTESNRRLVGVRRVPVHHRGDSKAAVTRHSPGGSLIWTC